MSVCVKIYLENINIWESIKTKGLKLHHNIDHIQLRCILAKYELHSQKIIIDVLKIYSFLISTMLHDYS